MIVVGGTPKDSSDGKKLLAAYGIEAVPVAVSPTPETQARLHQQPALLETKLCQILSAYPPQLVVLNCVSMSFAIDWERFDLPGYEIHELTSVFYQHIVLNPNLQHSALGLIVADALTLRRILAFFERMGFLPPLMAYANLELISLYESSPTEGKRELLRIIGRFADLGASDVILGCTHLSDEALSVEAGRGVRIIQPGLILLERDGGKTFWAL